MNMKSSHNFLVETDADIIHTELQRVLGERRFSGAPQMSAFLRYIVTETLNGHADRIKAFSVGVDALGKPDTFDAQTDPSVRVLALRLRKTLAAVYEDLSNCHAIIDLQVGTYVPNFYKPEIQQPSVAEPYSDAPRPTVVAALSRSTAAHSPMEPRAEDAKAGKSEPREEVGRYDYIDKEKSPIAKPSAGTAVSGLVEAGEQQSCRRESQDFTLENLWSGKLTIIAGAVLLAAAWQISLTRADAQITSSLGANSALSVMSASSGMLSSVESFEADSKPLGESSQLPTIFISDSNADPELEKQVLMMLSSRFLQSGKVSVVRISDDQFKLSNMPGEYQLLINGYTVDNDTHVDAQIVSLADGALLFAQSVILGESTLSLTSENVGAIETIVSGIVSVDGPVYEDYCFRQANSLKRNCPVG